MPDPRNPQRDSDVRAAAEKRVADGLRAVDALPGAAAYQYEFFGTQAVTDLDDMAPAGIEWGVRTNWDDRNPTTWRGDDAEDKARAHLAEHGGELIRHYVSEWNEVWDRA